MKEYVLGFAFEGQYVLLIRKNKPEWQEGKLNGIGGKIEDFDSCPEEAMVREFWEECGVKTFKSDWHKVGEMGDDETFKVHVFSTREVELDHTKSMTDELVGQFFIYDAKLGLLNSVSNIPWLVSMCLDKDNKEKQFNVTYKLRNK